MISLSPPPRYNPNASDDDDDNKTGSGPSKDKDGVDANGKAEGVPEVPTPSAEFNPSNIGEPPGKEDPEHKDIYVPPNAKPGEAAFVLRWDPNINGYAVAGYRDPQSGKWVMYDAAAYKDVNSKFLTDPDANKKLPPPDKNHPDYFVPPTGNNRVLLRWNPSTQSYAIMGVERDGKVVLFPNMATVNMVKAANPNIPPPPLPKEDKEPGKAKEPEKAKRRDPSLPPPPPKVNLKGGETDPAKGGPSPNFDPTKLNNPPIKEDPEHKDVLVPPNPGPGELQFLMRYDKNINGYAVVGYKKPDGTWEMFDAEQYRAANESFLKQENANKPIPKESKSHPDFFTPKEGDQRMLMRWDPEKQRHVIVGIETNGKLVMLTNKAAVDMLDYQRKDIFPNGEPLSPLPAPEYGTTPAWGSDPTHPSFYAPSQNDPEGKMYMWAWDSHLGRYVAIGEANRDGTNPRTYKLKEFRTKNGGPEALRPNPTDIPPAIPKGKQGYPVDQPHAEPEAIYILWPPAPGSDGKWGHMKGVPIYRTDENGNEIMVGIIYKDNNGKEKIHYFTPSEMAEYSKMDMKKKTNEPDIPVERIEAGADASKELKKLLPMFKEMRVVDDVVYAKMKDGTWRRVGSYEGGRFIPDQYLDPQGVFIFADPKNKFFDDVLPEAKKRFPDVVEVYLAADGSVYGRHEDGTWEYLGHSSSSSAFGPEIDWAKDRVEKKE